MVATEYFMFAVGIERVMLEKVESEDLSGILILEMMVKREASR